MNTKINMKNYELTDKDSGKNLAIIRITEGEFKEVEFSLGKVRFGEDDNEETCKVTFDFEVIIPPKDISVQEAEKMIELQDTIGKILLNILEEQAALEDRNANVTTEPNP